MANASLDSNPTLIANLPDILDRLLAIAARGLVAEAFMLELLERGFAPHLLNDALAAMPERTASIAATIATSAGVAGMVEQVIGEHAHNHAKTFSTQMTERMAGSSFRE